MDLWETLKEIANKLTDLINTILEALKQ